MCCRLVVLIRLRFCDQRLFVLEKKKYVPDWTQILTHGRAHYQTAERQTSAAHIYAQVL